MQNNLSFGEVKDSSVINVTYYDVQNSIFKPSRTDRERVSLYRCECPEKCDAYKNKMCKMLGGLFGESCPHGNKQTITGYTRNSSQCGKLIKEYKDRYKDQCYALSQIKHTCKCTDFIYLTLPWLDQDDLPRRSIDYNGNPRKDYDYEKTIGIEIHDKVKHKNCVKIENFTPEFIKRLIDFRPQAYFGGTLTRYYDEYLPQFCYDIKKYFPNLYEQTKLIQPEIEDLANKISFIGKRAKVCTLNPGKVKVEIYPMNWDGEKLTGVANKFSFISDLKDAQVVIYPTKYSIVEIIDNDTVKDDTEFV